MPELLIPKPLCESLRCIELQNKRPLSTLLPVRKLPPFFKPRRTVADWGSQLGKACGGTPAWAHPEATKAWEPEASAKAKGTGKLQTSQTEPPLGR